MVFRNIGRSQLGEYGDFLYDVLYLIFSTFDVDDLNRNRLSSALVDALVDLSEASSSYAILLCI